MQMTQNNHHNGRFGLGFSCFTLGAAVGACMAALYTPYSGKRTRRLLQRRAEDVQELAADTGREIAERGRDLYERGTKLAESAVGH
jgi:gas vesicle protein